MNVVHLTDVEVEIPKRALSFATAAERAGWRVVVTTTRGPARTPAGEEVRTVHLEQQSAEQGGGRKQVVGDVKVIDVVAVRCRRVDQGRPDLVVAIWEDGSFDSAYRPLALKVLSSTEATEHVKREAVPA